jgi:methionyl-tRNA formyltransferase
MAGSPPPPVPKTRVAVFGSFYRGYHILSNLLSDPELMKRIEIVGVATDDPAQKYTSAAKRVWQYAHTQQEENMVAELAGRNGIPVFKGKVKSP